MNRLQVFVLICFNLLSDWSISVRLKQVPVNFSLFLLLGILHWLLILGFLGISFLESALVALLTTKKSCLADCVSQQDEHVNGDIHADDSNEEPAALTARLRLSHKICEAAKKV